MADNLQEIIKKSTFNGITSGKPFEFMMKLSITGEKDYGVNRKKSFEYGLNHSLDWYYFYKMTRKYKCKTLPLYLYIQYAHL